MLHAADGHQALEMLRSRSIDVVLLDLLMPRMGGREALRHMRQDHPRTLVIIVTAVTDLTTVVTCVKLGAWNYVAKPWDDETLIALVHGAVRERRDEPGILLISDDLAAMAPLHLTLERQTRVFTTRASCALRCSFRPTAIVLDSAAACSSPINQVLQERFPKTPLILMKSVNETLAQLAEHGVINHENNRNTSVAAAVNFIAAHYCEPLTVSTVASAVKLSESRLAHVFPEITGLSVKDYMARLRVHIARRLLVETADTIEMIAAELGFADASSFSRTFKSVDGIAPGEFRRHRNH